MKRLSESLAHLSLRLQKRFEMHIQRTRCDSMALTPPGLHRQLAIYVLEMLLGGDRITRRVMRHIGETGARDLLARHPERVAGIFLEAMGVAVDMRSGSHRNFPVSGPLVVVGNHPHGILEIMALAAEIGKVRSDVKALVNLSIAHHPLYADYCLPIDFRETAEAARVNLRSAAAFRAHIKQGGVGLIAPAGSISDRKSLTEKASDDPWQTSAAKWARQAGATVVPAYCGSENPILFHIATKISMTLRRGLIYHQNWLLKDVTLPIAIGDPVTPEVMNAFATAREATEFLRAATYALDALVNREAPEDGLEAAYQV